MFVIYKEIFEQNNKFDEYKKSMYSSICSCEGTTNILFKYIFKKVLAKRKIMRYNYKADLINELVVVP